MYVKKLSWEVFMEKCEEKQKDKQKKHLKATTQASQL